MSIDLRRHRPTARLLIRLLGLYFIVDGLVSVVGNGLSVFWTMRAVTRAGMTYEPDYDLGWLIASVLELLLGLYLMFGGRMAMDAVFHESLAKPAVPCPDCGFDLRGNPEAEQCPECGAVLNPSEKKGE